MLKEEWKSLNRIKTLETCFKRLGKAGNSCGLFVRRPPLHPTDVVYLVTEDVCCSETLIISSDGFIVKQPIILPLRQQRVIRRMAELVKLGVRWKDEK